MTSAEMARGERHTFPVQNRPGVTVEPRTHERFLAQYQSYLHLFPRLQPTARSADPIHLALGFSIG